MWQAPRCSDTTSWYTELYNRRREGEAWKLTKNTEKKVDEECGAAHLEFVAIDALAASSITAREVTTLDHEAGLHTGHTIHTQQTAFCPVVFTVSSTCSACGVGCYRYAGVTYMMILRGPHCFCIGGEPGFEM